MSKGFTHEEYVKIITSYVHRVSTFSEALELSDFVIIRHDVEFSVSRALKLAQLENSKGVKSTYFFQVMSSAYNPFSNVHCEAIQKIKSLGHSVGLHLYISHLEAGDLKSLHNELRKQKILFEAGLGLECESFSFHRPPTWALEIREDKVCNMINAYGPSFFEFSNRPRSIKYVADSKHTWAYGHPLEQLQERKVQILMHPDEWTKEGDETLVEFFNGLKKEHEIEFDKILYNETKHYAQAFGGCQ